MPEDVMLQEAISAIEQGQRNRARDLLTRLLRADKNNPEYWLWLSSVVDTKKEQIYCLKSVLNLDPQNQAAKKGLVLLGAMKSDEEIQQLPWIKRQWSVRLQEVPKEKFWNLPWMRLVFLMVGVMLIMGLIALGVFTISDLVSTPVAIIPTSTAGPSPTFTYTPTPLNYTPRPATATPTFAGPPPLWTLLKATYTPTPLYVNTPHVSEAYRVALNAFMQGDFVTALEVFQQLVQSEPQAADIHFYMGEIYRLQKEYAKAMDAYDNAIEANPDFAPAYLGRARVLRITDPKVDVFEDLRLAIEKDPNLVEAYLELVSYALDKGDLEAAAEYLAEAEKRLPAESPLVYLYQAQIDLANEDYEQALLHARRANQLDRTALLSYRILAEAAIKNEYYSEAKQALDIYMQYAPEDAQGWLIYGQALFYTQEYSQTIQTLNKALELDPNLTEVYVWRGKAYLELGEGQKAVNDFLIANQKNPGTFEINFYIGRGLFAAEREEEALNQLIFCESLAEEDEQLAQVYYWRAQVYEALGNRAAARKDWQALLALPEESFPEAWRRIAEARLTPTPTPSPTAKP